MVINVVFNYISNFLVLGFFRETEYQRREWQKLIPVFFSSVHLLSHVWLFATPWTAALQASLSITNSWSLLKLKSIESAMPSNHLILYCPLLFLPSIFPNFRSQFLPSGGQSIGVTASTLVLPMNIQDWFPLGLTGLSPSPRDPQSLLQHHSSKASILQCSAFFMVQLSHPYMTTGETTALTRWTFVGKVMFAF